MRTGKVLVRAPWMPTGQRELILLDPGWQQQLSTWASLDHALPREIS